MNSVDAALLDCIECAIYVLEADESGHPTFSLINETLYRMIEVDANDIIGYTAKQAFSRDVGEIIHAQHVAAFASGEAKSFQCSISTNDRELLVQIHLNIVSLAGDAPLRVVGTVQEISSEADPGDKQSQIAFFNREQEAFINLAAHDLRTPISNVKVLTGLLLQDFEDLGDGKLAMIEQLDKVSSKVLVLIGDVLSRAEAHDLGEGETSENFELEPLCRDVLAILDPAGVHCVKVDNCVIHGDRTATQIVLRNLVDNAIKHNRGSAIVLSISVDNFEVGFYQVTVQDNGVGLNDITLKFLNGGELRSGSGFGLLGIRNLIKLRGGFLAAKNSESGQRGAAISFSLPGELLA